MTAHELWIQTGGAVGFSDWVESAVGRDAIGRLSESKPPAVGVAWSPDPPPPLENASAPAVPPPGRPSRRRAR